MCVGLKFIFVFSPLFSSIFVHQGQLVRMRSPVQVWSSAPNPWTKFVHGFFISLCNKDIKARFSTVRSARRHRTAIENTSCSHRLCLPSSAQKKYKRKRSRIFHIYDMKCTHCAKACGALVGCARHPKMRCAFFFLCLPSSAQKMINEICSRIFSYLRYEMHALCQSVRGACRLRTASKNAMRFLLPMLAIIG